MVDAKNFKVPLVSPSGEAVCSSGWSLVNWGDQYKGKIREEDILIQALRAVNQADPNEPVEELTPEQTELFRSFVWAITHLQDSNVSLFEVFDLGLPLSRSADYIWRIGMFDRAANAVIGITGAATCLGLCVFGLQAGAVTGGAVVGGLVGDAVATFLVGVDSRLGGPGKPINRSQFEASSLLHLLRLFQIRHLVPRAEFEPDAQEHVYQILDAQIFRLFIVNSRQISGLALAGEAEASSAVVAHSLISLTLSHLPDNKEILNKIQANSKQLESAHQDELLSTLAGVRETISGQDVQEIERRLNRYLLSSSTAEAMDMAVQPVRLAFGLFGSVAQGLGTVVGGGSSDGKGNLFQVVGEQLKTVSAAVDMTPDMASKALNSQFAVEAWTRKKIGDMWATIWSGKETGQQK